MATTTNLSELDNTHPANQENTTNKMIEVTHSLDALADDQLQIISSSSRPGEAVGNIDIQASADDDEARKKIIEIILASCMPIVRVMYIRNPYTGRITQRLIRSHLVYIDLDDAEIAYQAMSANVKRITDGSRIRTRALETIPGVLEWDKTWVSWEPSVIPYYITLRYCFHDLEERERRRAWLICADDERPVDEQAEELEKLVRSRVFRDSIHRILEVHHAETSLSSNPILRPSDSTDWLASVIDRRCDKQRADAARKELDRIKKVRAGLLSNLSLEEAEQVAAGICTGLMNLETFEEYAASLKSPNSLAPVQTQGSNYWRNLKNRTAKKRKGAQKRLIMSPTDICDASLGDIAEIVAEQHHETSNEQTDNKQGESSRSRSTHIVDTNSDELSESSGNLQMESAQLSSMSGLQSLAKGKEIDRSQYQSFRKESLDSGTSVKTEIEVDPSQQKSARRERSNSIKFLRERTSSRESSKHATADLTVEAKAHPSPPSTPTTSATSTPLPPFHSLDYRGSATQSLRNTLDQHPFTPTTTPFPSTEDQVTVIERSDESFLQRPEDQNLPPLTSANTQSGKKKPKKKTKRKRFPITEGTQPEAEPSSTPTAAPNLTQASVQTPEEKYRTVLEAASKKVAIPYQLLKSVENHASSLVGNEETARSSHACSSEMSPPSLNTLECDKSSHGSSKPSLISPPLYPIEESVEEELDKRPEITRTEHGSIGKKAAKSKPVPVVSTLGSIEAQRVTGPHNSTDEAEDQVSGVLPASGNYAVLSLSSTQVNARDSNTKDIAIAAHTSTLAGQTQQSFSQVKSAEDPKVPKDEHDTVDGKTDSQTRKGLDELFSEGVVQLLRRHSLPAMLKSLAEPLNLIPPPEDEAEGIGRFWYQKGVRREHYNHSPWAATVNWFYISNNTQQNEGSQHAGLLAVVRPHQHFPPASRNPRLLYDKTQTPATLSSVSSPGIYPSITFNANHNCFIILPHVVPLADVRSNPSHPDYLPPNELVHYQAYEIAGFDVWRHDRNRFKCQKPGCGSSTDDHELATTFCQACGPNSYIRYCSRQHLLDDMENHWSECRHPGSILKCVVDETTMPPRFHKRKPGLYNVRGYISFELHRQTIHAAFNGGQYTLFTTTGLPVLAKWPTPELEALHAPRVERLLNYALTDSSLKILVSYLYSLLRYCLRISHKWTDNVSRALRNQFFAEFQFDARLAPDGDPCECWWAGGDGEAGVDGNAARSRHKNCSEACRTFWKGVGVDFKGQGLVKFLEEGERHEWLLRVWRTQHPTVKDWRKRMVGEGIEGFTADDREALRNDFEGRNLWTRWVDVDGRIED
ncbi:MAG: hypothetical protein MMC33_000076 [Icmadophila ericetorum]|nr:hypothetical protein [Icmadophila ericetorum]